MSEKSTARNQDISASKSASKTAPSYVDADEMEIAFSKRHAMDYVLKNEVIKRIRLENEADWYLFMLKEKFDNAIDFLWKHYPSNLDVKQVAANVVIDDTNNKLFHCNVANSNVLNKPVFSDLASILDFDMTYGTKQNDYKITRGILGDAIKQLSTMAYTLMKEQYASSSAGNEQWDYPMTFIFNNKEYEATLNVDKMNQRIEAVPVLVSNRIKQTNTEIANTWCLIDKVREARTEYGYRNDNYLNATKIEQYCRKYTIFTTDVSFHIRTVEKKTGDNAVNERVIDVPATATNPISSKWFNVASIFYYTLEQFTNWLYAVDDKNNVTVYRLIKKLREWNQIPKKSVSDLEVPIGEFLKDPLTRDQKIKALYLKLRTQGKIRTPPDRLSLPYTVKEERKKALAERLGDIFEDLDPPNAAYEILHGVVEELDHASGQIVQYPFAFEIVAVPYDEESIALDQSAYKSKFFVGAINYSVSPEPNIFEGDYSWFDKKKNKQFGADNIRQIFERYEFGFSDYYVNKQVTKIPCIIVANLISPKLSYKSEGKSDVDMTPFSQLIPDAVAKIARQIRTFRAADIDTIDKEEKPREKRNGRGEPKPPRAPRVSIKDVVEEMLLPRINQVNQAKREGRPLPQFEEETQDSIWYDALPLFDKYNVRYSNKSRPGFKNEIRELCKLHNVFREEIGIIAAPWGSMYYMGEWYDISYHTLKDLALKGTDIIFIEKRDIVQNLGRFAADMRIALVNTHGHLSESTKELARLAEDSEGANVALLTDYDLPGIHIASKLPGVIRLGVDERMLRYFRIPHENEPHRLLVVSYNPKKKMLDETIDEILEDERFSSKDIIDIEFLKRKKVEIDAVLSDQGARALWDYILMMLAKEKPKRDCTRVIPSNVYTETPAPPVLSGTLSASAAVGIVSKLQSYVKDRSDQITVQPKQEIVEELEEYEGFIEDFNAKEQEIHDELQEVIDDDIIINDIANAVDRVMDEVKREVSNAQVVFDAAAAKAGKAIIEAIQKLDAEKGYGIIAAIEEEGGSQN